MRSLAAIAAVALLSLGACSGGADRPDLAELTASLTADGASVPVPAQAAECFAQGLLDSDLSDETLAEIADEKKPTTEQDQVTELGLTLIEDCLSTSE